MSIDNNLNKTLHTEQPQNKKEVTPVIAEDTDENILNEKVLKNNTEHYQADEKIDIGTEKQKYSKFIDSTKSLINIFNKRNGDGLSSLLYEENLSIMRSTITKIEDLFNQEKINQNDLNEQIDKIGATIDSVGEARRGGREDVDSLTALIIKLKGLGEECDNLTKTILKSDTKEQAENSIKALEKISQSCDTKSKLIIKLREAFANYTRR